MDYPSERDLLSVLQSISKYYKHQREGRVAPTTLLPSRISLSEFQSSVMNHLRLSCRRSSVMIVTSIYLHEERQDILSIHDASVCLDSTVRRYINRHYSNHVLVGYDGSSNYVSYTKEELILATKNYDLRSIKDPKIWKYYYINNPQLTVYQDNDNPIFENKRNGSKSVHYRIRNDSIKIKSRNKSVDKDSISKSIYVYNHNPSKHSELTHYETSGQIPKGKRVTHSTPAIKRKTGKLSYQKGEGKGLGFTQLSRHYIHLFEGRMHMLEGLHSYNPIMSKNHDQLVGRLHQGRKDNKGILLNIQANHEVLYLNSNSREVKEENKVSRNIETPFSESQRRLFLKIRGKKFKRNKQQVNCEANELSSPSISVAEDTTLENRYKLKIISVGMEELRTIDTPPPISNDMSNLSSESRSSIGSKKDTEKSYQSPNIKQHESSVNGNEYDNDCVKTKMNKYFDMKKKIESEFISDLPHHLDQDDYSNVKKNFRDLLEANKSIGLKMNHLGDLKNKSLAESNLSMKSSILSGNFIEVSPDMNQTKRSINKGIISEIDLRSRSESNVAISKRILEGEKKRFQKLPAIEFNCTYLYDNTSEKIHKYS